MKILVACEFSGRVRDAFIKKGHDVVSCDTLPTESPGPHYRGDVLPLLTFNWDMLIAFPPCTYLACTGNKWFKPEFKDRFPTREQDREEAIIFFMHFANSTIKRICIENPVGIMSTRWRKPDQYIQPFDFGDKHIKKTGLWLKNLPLLKKTKIVEPQYKLYNSKTNRSKKSKFPIMWSRKSSSKERGRTFQGIADAMAEQWG